MWTKTNMRFIRCRPPTRIEEIPKITSDEETLYQKLLQDFSFQTAADVLQSQQGNVVYSPVQL